MFDWITNLIDAMGAFGVALLMFLENVFPPIPSELIMPLAGFNAARGTMSLPLIIAAGSAGSLAGAYLWYWIGRRIGYDRLCQLSQKHGRWLSVSPDEFEQANGWFDRHDGSAVLIGRLIPTVRTFISVPAGVRRMRRGLFLALSALGTVAWTTVLTLAGYWLESGYDAVSDWLDPVSTLVVLGLIGTYLWRVATYKRRAEKRSAKQRG
ncbi:alkaline phosphatase [Salipiger aestuarii]|uniref:Membrane protein DedA with SNARE-associated domain n=1 Tax=Salipiger aestuarii TaxID=568098 RepID=A0A327YE66_9RHOB|nr:DedA family protein [Salipiger aestuarii]EIE51381.1 SNARE associated golgi family protein [Citreicella sp. 357]KAA8608595.1 alkaline phosphatase [Salipiger aestuarii]KAA8614156.1 alkaline phosphatase [Salipiger aestuarii]KAB2542332.1 alkaline phosphatase [Salipiger aestuarii]RAK18356.1 membrane protein DedA with SNARE-associated domain [Salipiger aestuarii]